MIFDQFLEIFAQIWTNFEAFLINFGVQFGCNIELLFGPCFGMIVNDIFMEIQTSEHMKNH